MMNTQTEPDTLLVDWHNRSIVLVGLMGSGKTKIGRRLASQLGLPFYDSDAEFEQAAGCTISDYFAEHGEASFREGERKIIQRLLQGPRSVIATGGGAFCEQETRRHIQALGLSIWLRADLDLLVSRTSGRDHRPLLKQGNPRDVLAALMEKRHPLYALADIIVDTTDEPPDVTIVTVYQALSAYLANPNPRKEPHVG